MSQGIPAGNAAFFPLHLLREIAYYIVFLDLPPERCSADAELLRNLALVAAELNQQINDLPRIIVA